MKKKASECRTAAYVHLCGRPQTGIEDRSKKNCRRGKSSAHLDVSISRLTSEHNLSSFGIGRTKLSESNDPNKYIRGTYIADRTWPQISKRRLGDLHENPGMI
jgi:hypothetical protein